MLVALNALVFIYAVLRGFWEIVCEGPRVGWCLVAQGLFRDFSRFLHRSNSTGWLYALGSGPISNWQVDGGPSAQSIAQSPGLQTLASTLDWIRI